jgi:hypothetical protein
MNADTVVALASGIAAIGIVYDTVEFLLGRQEILERFFDVRIVRSRYYILINRPLRGLVFDLLSSRRVFLTVVALHGVAAALFPLVVLYSHGLAAGLAAVVLAVHCLANVRLCVGRDGADQMQNIVWAALLGYCLPITETGRLMCLAFVPAQLILSYWTSGIAKVISPVWRQGSAVHLITRMETYCSPGVAAACGRPWVSKAFSWLTIAFEVGAPFLLIFGWPGALTFIVCATLFHVGIALTMGLTTFVFAFGAALPIVYYLSTVVFGY